MAGSAPKGPTGAALAFCIACLAVCGYTWMRYSYAWDVTPESLGPLLPEHDTPLCLDRFVRLRGLSCRAEVYACVQGNVVPVPPNSPRGHYFVWVAEPERPETAVAVYIEDYRWSPEEVTFVGRIETGGLNALAAGYVNVMSSRFHPASLAGIVVGAMGCFIFGLYLRRWLREKKAA